VELKPWFLGQIQSGKSLKVLLAAPAAGVRDASTSTDLRNKAIVIYLELLLVPLPPLLAGLVGEGDWSESSSRA
jgi:hypothetical protein